MILRDAEPDDAAKIAAYWNPQIRSSAITFTTVEKDFEALALEIAARQAEGQAYLVASKDGRILGHATYFPFRGGPGYARTMEHTVILDPAAHGKGVARALMSALEEHALKAGIHALMAGISGENHRAIAFHEEIGYRTVGTIPEVGFKFGRWMDLVLMQKLL